MKIPISMFCPLPPELVALAGGDELATLLPVPLVAVLPLLELLAKPPP